MSYTPTNWQNGDVITSEKLNKIENGISSAGGGTDILFATLIPTTMALDKTFQELASAEVAYVTMEQVTPSGTSRPNMPVIYTIADQTNNEYYVVGLGATKVSGEGTVSFEPMIYTFKATSADGYPVLQM